MVGQLKNLKSKHVIFDSALSYVLHVVTAETET